MTGFSLNFARRGHFADGAGVSMDFPRLDSGAPSLAATPLHRDAALRLSICADLRLDNRRDLATALRLDGGASAFDILAHGWRAWGRSLADMLRGSFALAIFDEISGELYCARDNFGLAPFYYAIDNRRLVAASSSRAVRAQLAQQPGRNLTMIADFVAGKIIEKEQTFFEGVQRLLPGYWMIVTADRRETRCYWSVRSVEPRDEVPDAVEQFRELFDRSVRNCHVAGSTMLMLSGGLDSSAILGSLGACGLAGPRLPSVSFTYPRSPDWDDGTYLKLLRKAFQLDEHHLPSDEHDPLEGMERHLTLLDGPYVSYGHSLSFRVQPLARELGMDVVLNGHGGDEIVSYGVGRLNELARAGKWLSLWRESAGAAAVDHESRFATFLPYLTHNPIFRRLQARFARPAAIGESAAAPLAPQLAEYVADDRYTARPPRTRRDHDERMLQQWALELPVQPMALEVFSIMSQAAGVETRMPFYDRDLAELSVSLPSRYKLRGGMTRAILREAMADRLPQPLLRRGDKYNFAENFNRGLLSGRDNLRELTGPGNAELRQFVNAERIAQVWRSASEEGAAMPVNDSFYLWRAAVLAMWLRIDTRSAEAVPVMAGAHG